MNRFLIGLFLIVTIVMVGLSIAYPEDFALALGTFVVGLALGSVVAYYTFTSIHDKGFERSQQLSLKQVTNPASFAREMRLADKEAAKSSPQQPQPENQAIPQFNMTGLMNE